MKIDYLSSDDIRELHDVAIERYGGKTGENEPGLIKFMAEKPSMEVYGFELYPGLFMKAAIYMEGFACKQLFVDGNKRTGYMCAATFLKLNGYMIVVDDEELYKMAMDVANNKITLDKLAQWLEEHSVPLT